MSYVEGFVIAVPNANQDAYRSHAMKAWSLLEDYGVQRMVDTWADEVPEGKITDFRRAVQAKDSEAVVFSWFEYPSKQARDAANEKMMSDPRMKEFASSMPFDGQRMIFGGFETLLDEGPRGKTGYVDGFVVPVPAAKQEAYRQFAGKHIPAFKEHGALRIVENWGDDVPEGKVTDFRKAVHAIPGENVVYSWIEWRSKAERDAAWQKLMADERMKPDHANTPFDGKRMFYGGFSLIMDV